MAARRSESTGAKAHQQLLEALGEGGGHYGTLYRDHMGASKNQKTQNRLQHTRILILWTSTMGPPIFGKTPMVVLSRLTQSTEHPSWPETISSSSASRPTGVGFGARKPLPICMIDCNSNSVVYIYMKHINNILYKLASVRTYASCAKPPTTVFNQGMRPKFMEPRMQILHEPM